MMRWWVDRGVDGFRMDVINLISKDPDLPDGPLIWPDRDLAPPLGVLNGPRLHEFLAEMNREVGLTDQHLLTVGEMPGSTVALARDVTDPARRELDMVFTFEHVALDQVPGLDKWALQDLPLPVLKANLAAWQVGLADVGWNSLYWDNHDQPRVVSRFGDDSPEHRVASAKTLGTVLHLHRGTPYVYQGEELGMTNAGFTRSSSTPTSSRSTGPATHCHAECPRQTCSGRWRSRAATTPALPCSGTPPSTAASRPVRRGCRPTPTATWSTPTAAVADPDSVFHHYRRLIELRHDDPVVVDGRFALLLPDDPQVWAFTRTLGDDTLLVLANCSSSPATIEPGSVPPLEGSEVLLPTHGSSYSLTLQPWESRVHRR